MRYAVAPIALAALAAAAPAPQGVTSAIAPSSAPPAGCQTSYNGEFMIQIVNVTSAKRDLESRQANTLMIKLANGVLTDSQGRTGYIAANSQLQFDAPPQTGAIYTSGFSVCSNGRLAIGDDTTWKSCLSGTFYNLYLENDAAQCNEVYIMAIGAGSSAGGAASQQPDGQPTGSAVAVMPDGQPTGSAVAAPVSQISDGQIQASTAAAPISQISDGQIQAPTAAPVTQISDGQIQAPTGAPVTQISDGQIQAPPAAPVTQISDGQIQAPTAAPVTQISDGQIQAPPPVAPVTQISDGQIQAPTPVAPVTQISDGQIQAPTANGTMVYPTPSVSIQAQVGAAGSVRAGSVFGLVAAVFGIALL